MSKTLELIKKNQRKINLFFKAIEYGLDGEKYKRWLDLKFVKPFDVDESNNKEYLEVLYCDRCKKKTRHRVKLGAIQYGCLVCNECDKMNEIKQNKDE